MWTQQRVIKQSEVLLSVMHFNLLLEKYVSLGNSQEHWNHSFVLWFVVVPNVVFVVPNVVFVVPNVVLYLSTTHLRVYK